MKLKSFDCVGVLLSQAERLTCIADADVSVRAGPLPPRPHGSPRQVRAAPEQRARADPMLVGSVRGRGLVPAAALPWCSTVLLRYNRIFSVHFYSFKAFEGLTVYSRNTILD